MAQSPISSPESYCSAQEFLDRVDFRWVAKILSLTGADVTLPNIRLNQTLLTALREASGDVDLYLFTAGRYTYQDVLALLGNGRETISGIVADLALEKLTRFKITEYAAIQPRVQQARMLLEGLYEGLRTLALQESADAGHMSHTVETADDVRARELATYQAGRLFGPRGNVRTGMGSG